MSEMVFISIALVVGVALGIFFFGGLWLTIKIAFNSKVPALWFFGSLTLRLAVTLVGFYYIGFGNWQRLIACVLGFIIARLIVVHITKLYASKRVELKEEDSHEA